MKSINSLIFKKCQSVFPLLSKYYFVDSDNLKLISSCKDENDIILNVIKKDIKNSRICVELFIEFFIGKKKHINPKFTLNLDFDNKKAEVISFESDLFPKIKLNVYSEINGCVYKNIVAEQDLEILCLNWLKQIYELNYKPICKLNQIA